MQAVLLSGIARLFMSIYSTKMRGGYLRFQAQYLRRIRVPLAGMMYRHNLRTTLSMLPSAKILPPATALYSSSTA